MLFLVRVAPRYAATLRSVFYQSIVMQSVAPSRRSQQRGPMKLATTPAEDWLTVAKPSSLFICRSYGSEKNKKITPGHAKNCVCPLCDCEEKKKPWDDLQKKLPKNIQWEDIKKKIPGDIPWDDLKKKMPTRDQVEKAFFKVAVIVWDISSAAFYTSKGLFNKYVVQNEQIRAYWKIFQKKLSEARQNK